MFPLWQRLSTSGTSWEAQLRYLSDALWRVREQVNDFRLTEDEVYRGARRGLDAHAHLSTSPPSPLPTASASEGQSSPLSQLSPQQPSPEEQGDRLSGW